jgi:stage IV sporulation protein B
MLYTKKIARAMVAFLFAFIIILNFSAYYVYADEEELYLGGFPAGFVLNTTEVEVVGLCEVVTDDGIVCPARDSGIIAGDIIERVNDREITSSGELNVALKENYVSYDIYLKRGDQQLKTSIKPQTEKASGEKKLGLLVKDSVNGIGTVTYLNKSKSTFASLGHPVTNSSGDVMKINGGSLYGCAIYDVKRGVRGTPGEIKGIFENTNMIGKVSKNCECGVYGEISKDYNYTKLTKIKRGNIGEVTIGKAEIYSTLNGDTAKMYEISIVKVDTFSRDNRNFVIKIEDKDLIETSGGIVQGMSGSPIVQNGKLIGAVTHVFINDPTRGYGIAIDKMLSSY